MTKQKEITP